MRPNGSSGRLFLMLSGAWSVLLSSGSILAQGSVEPPIERQPAGPERPCCNRYMAMGAGVGMAASYFWLDRAWYAQYDRSAFHFFNDGEEWMQMDKAGHFFSAYTLGSWGHAGLAHCGAKGSRARWLGGSVGLVFLTGIEVLDGTSAGWGFSWWDMAANAAGTSLFIAQDAAWGRQRIRPKLSAHLTDYAAIRPDLLGEGLPERILKDYNGQTFWLSFHGDLLWGEGRLPPWLNLAVGYGAEGMVRARADSAEEAQPAAYRQFFLSPDIDLTRIPTRKKWLRTLLFVANGIKVPAPALEYGDGTWRGHWLYF